MDLLTREECIEEFLSRKDCLGQSVKNLDRYFFYLQHRGIIPTAVDFRGKKGLYPAITVDILEAVAEAKEAGMKLKDIKAGLAHLPCLSPDGGRDLNVDMGDGKDSIFKGKAYCSHDLNQVLISWIGPKENESFKDAVLLVFTQPGTNPLKVEGVRDRPRMRFLRKQYGEFIKNLALKKFDEGELLTDKDIFQAIKNKARRKKKKK